MVDVGCPDDLVARAADPRLPGEARGRLNAHLARCRSCRIAVRARADFESGPDALPGDDRLLARVTASVAAVPAGLGVARRRTSPLVRVAAAASILLGAAAAGGAMVTIALSPSPAIEESAPVRRPRPRVAPSPAASAPEPPLAREAPRRPPRARPVGVPEAPRLFAEANERRRAGDTRAAERLYRQLQARHAASDEARLSHVTVGELLLERGRAGEALPQFDAYLRRGPGSLSEEALVGKARALAALGRTADERSAWRELLRLNPQSVHARRARERLAQP